ncbi:unnamed protein product, partial [Mesorhabditis belari]|uniref:Uncharacterized protein n=1 Tax=Mesorhabditis belari TaxID=2138241 RepID=A0AAF3FQL0_9BILA
MSDVESAAEFSGASIKSKTEKKQVDPGWEFSATGFSAEDLVKVWILYASFLMSTKRFDEARDLLKKALNCFAGRGICSIQFQKQNMLHSFLVLRHSTISQKRSTYGLCTWMTMKYDIQDTIRNFFDRICSLSLTNHKQRPFYKRWAEYEAKFGDRKTRDRFEN